MIELAEAVFALHDSLATARIPHAFGGAIALAYCINEPRATRDIDLNIFVGLDRVDETIAALPKMILEPIDCVTFCVSRRSSTSSGRAG
ncbi:MAG: nucleotidyl transferase AbiEii/AbiGii toxin family protein [Actinomycetota bacterium]